MSGWAIVAIVAIVMAALVKMVTVRRDGGQGARPPVFEDSAQRTSDDAAARREIEALRGRVEVLERIATDGNTLDASETRRISQEIEALRGDAAPGGRQDG